MMKVLIATKNQGKIEGAKKALLNYFDNVEIVGIPVESNVATSFISISLIILFNSKHLWIPTLSVYSLVFQVPSKYNPYHLPASHPLSAQH